MEIEESKDASTCITSPTDLTEETWKNGFLFSEFPNRHPPHNTALHFGQ
jgi:hypothetical protein